MMLVRPPRPDHYQVRCQLPQQFRVLIELAAARIQIRDLRAPLGHRVRHADHLDAGPIQKRPLQSMPVVAPPRVTKDRRP